MPETAPDPTLARRMLVVEDEPAMCDLLADIVEGEGFSTRCVRTDVQAYDTIHREAAFACMIVDVNLGRGGTGYDVARYARRIEPALPVIYVSGQTNPESFRLHGVPGSLFLAKPFTPQELLEQVRRLVGDNDDAA